MYVYPNRPCGVIQRLQVTRLHTRSMKPVGGAATSAASSRTSRLPPGISPPHVQPEPAACGFQVGVAIGGFWVGRDSRSYVLHGCPPPHAMNASKRELSWLLIASRVADVLELSLPCTFADPLHQERASAGLGWRPRGALVMVC